jgi:hypothetical protein
MVGHSQFSKPLTVGRVGLEPTTHGLALVPVLWVLLVEIFSLKSIIAMVLYLKVKYRKNRIEIG